MCGRGKRVLAAFAVLAILLFPGLADARLGGGGSIGSRGGMTFSPPPVTNTAPNVASPFGRTMTSPTPSPGYGSPGSPGYAPRSSFTSGLMGGLIGAGIGGLLFGGGFFGHGLGFGGFPGFLLQVFLLVMLGRFLWRDVHGQSVSGPRRRTWPVRPRWRSRRNAGRHDGRSSTSPSWRSAAGRYFA